MSNYYDDNDFDFNENEDFWNSDIVKMNVWGAMLHNSVNDMNRRKEEEDEEIRDIIRDCQAWSDRWGDDDDTSQGQGHA